MSRNSFFPHNFPPTFSLFLLPLWTPQVLFHYLVLLSCLSSVILCCSPCSLISNRQPEVRVFIYIDLSIFNGPSLPREGAISCRFRWASDAVRACCHSALLRARAHDLGSALRVMPREKDVSISPWSHMEIPDGLYWANHQGNAQTSMLIFNDCTQPRQVHFS